MIRLEHDDWALALRPDLGAAITSLTWRGRNILRPAPVEATDPLETASFPLLPYANRIDRGAFTFAGRDVVVRRTAGFEPHALHGIGWLRPWAVLETGHDFVELALATEASPDWPWAWTASHGLRLDGDGLEMTLSITNENRDSMPAGLGLHPYFAITPESVLTAPSPHVWLNDATDIPNRLAPATDLFDWSQGKDVASAPFVDNAYAGWSGEARLEHPSHVIDMIASPNARWLQIYAPRDAAFVCVEPVTHRPDAHNAPADEVSGLIGLASGESLSMSMRINASDRTTFRGDRP